MLLLPLKSCFRSTRSVTQTHAPVHVVSASFAELVQATNSRYQHIETMNASIEIAVSTGGTKDGKVVEYSAFPGYLLLRKPGDLRVLLFTPVGHVQAIDMVTNGTTFTMHIPYQKRAITGSNAITTMSAKPLENLRPELFFDALLIHGAMPEDLIALTSDERIFQPDPTRKDVLDEPEYDLSIYRHAAGSPELKTQRVLHIGRAALLPYQQDTYDDKGQLITVATYDNYQKFGEELFPSTINIRRPIDQLQLKVTITKLTVNQKLEDDQFELKLPANTQVQKLP